MKELYTFRRTLSAALLLMTSALTWAYDYKANDIFYNLIAYKGVEVTYSSTGIGTYRGEIRIPSTVTITKTKTTYNVTAIGENAFYNCRALTKITIPNSITHIGICAFWYCDGLTELTIPNSVTYIGESAFSHCRNITKIGIPNGITSIERFTFSNCSSLSEVTIPNSVTSIGFASFQECSSLTEITIPDSVTTIGDYAFNLCSSLSSIISFNVTPPVIEQYTFNEDTEKNATLHVPIGSKDAYSTSPYWKNFLNIIEDMPNKIAEVTEDMETKNAPYYTLDGIRVENPTKKGIYIRNGKKVAIK